MVLLMEITKVQLTEQFQIKYLCVKVFLSADNLEYDGYQRRLASMVYKFFD